MYKLVCKKNISFTHEVQIIEISMSADDVSARRGTIWMQAAVDRNRFKRKVSLFSKIIDNVLSDKYMKIVNPSGYVGLRKYYENVE